MKTNILKCIQMMRALSKDSMYLKHRGLLHRPIFQQSLVRKFGTFSTPVDWLVIAVKKLSCFPITKSPNVAKLCGINLLLTRYMKTSDQKERSMYFVYLSTKSHFWHWSSHKLQSVKRVFNMWIVLKDRWHASIAKKCKREILIWGCLETENSHGKAEERDADQERHRSYPVTSSTI